MNLTLFVQIFRERISVILLAKYCKLKNRSIAWPIFYLINLLHKIGTRRVSCRDYDQRDPRKNQDDESDGEVECEKIEKLLLFDSSLNVHPIQNSRHVFPPKFKSVYII